MKSHILEQFGRIERGHAVVLVASLALMAATCFLRIALSGDISFWNVLASAALLLLDIGVALQVHSTGKRLQESRQVRRDYDVQVQELETVQRRCAEIAAALAVIDVELRKAEAQEALRQRLDFDVSAQRQWAASLVHSGYHAAINVNTSNTRIGARRTA